MRLRKLGVDVAKPDETLEKLKSMGYRNSTITTYLSALINLVRTKKEEKGLLKDYQRLLRLVKTDADQESTGLTANQAKAKRPWSEIEALRDGLVDTDPYDYMVMCLYTMVPPLRDDYRDVEFTVKRLGNSTGTNWYYLSEDGQADELILNHYKTRKSYGQHRQVFPPELAQIVREYRRTHGMGPYMVPKKTDSREPAGSDVSTALRRVLGPGGGSSLLRKIAVSDWTERGLGGVQHLAKAMCHSVDVQQNSYNQHKLPAVNSMGIFLPH